MKINHSFQINSLLIYLKMISPPLLGELFCGGILPSYGTAGSMIPRYLFCLFLCTAVPPAGFSIYIFINTTVTFIGTSGHSVHMS